jgi:hypothetical protein
MSFTPYTPNLDELINHEPEEDCPEREPNEPWFDYHRRWWFWWSAKTAEQSRAGYKPGLKRY